MSIPGIWLFQNIWPWKSKIKVIAQLYRLTSLLLHENQTSNRIAWQWAETLVEIRVTLADIRGLDCSYSPQNIFNAKNFNPHKKPISLLNVPICTQGMQRTWWPEAGTIIATGPYSWHTLFQNLTLKIQGQGHGWGKMSRSHKQPGIHSMYRQVSNIRRTKSQHLKDSRTVLQLSLPNPLLGRERRCSWSSADRRCSNYIWVIDNFIAN